MASETQHECQCCQKLQKQVIELEDRVSSLSTQLDEFMPYLLTKVNEHSEKLIGFKSRKQQMDDFLYGDD